MLHKSLTGLILTLAVAASAEPRPTQKKPLDTPAKDSVAQLWGLPWHSTMAGTADAAAKAKGKYVLWLRLLGDLAGKS